MDDALLVSRPQALGGLDGEVERLIELERAFGDRVADGLTLDELHDDKGAPVGFVDVVDDRYVGMGQCRGGFSFTPKARGDRVVIQQMGGEKLQSDRALELGVLGLVDDTHAAFAELLGDLVVRDSLADHGSPLAWGDYTATGLLVVTTANSTGQRNTRTKPFSSNASAS